MEVEEELEEEGSGSHRGGENGGAGGSGEEMRALAGTEQGLAHQGDSINQLLHTKEDLMQFVNMCLLLDGGHRDCTGLQSTQYAYREGGGDNSTPTRI